MGKSGDSKIETLSAVSLVCRKFAPLCPKIATSSPAATFAFLARDAADLLSLFVYYAAVLIGRVIRLARPSVPFGLLRINQKETGTEQAKLV